MPKRKSKQSREIIDEQTHWGFWDHHQSAGHHRKHSAVQSQPTCNPQCFRKSSYARVGASRSGANSETATRIYDTHGLRDLLALTKTPQIR